MIFELDCAKCSRECEPTIVVNRKSYISCGRLFADECKYSFYDRSVNYWECQADLDEEVLDKVLAGDKCGSVGCPGFVTCLVLEPDWPEDE